jgi:methyl-accepting chemotaxis protein
MLTAVVISGWLLGMVAHERTLESVSGVVATLFLGLVGMRYAALRQGRDLPALCESLADLAAEAAAQDHHLRAQNSLDRNLDLLREILYGYGEPNRRGDDLYFGNRRINGDFEAVDQVKLRFGGTATVFLEDRRIATNVQAANGSRAVGTRLAQGRTRDTVLGESKMFRGEAEVLGEPHFTIYEPVISDAKTVGILYVGVKKTMAQSVAAKTMTTDTATDMVASVSAIRAAVHAQAQAAEEAIAQRLSADDARRQSEMARQAAGAHRRRVVEILAHGLERLSGGDLIHRLRQPFTEEYEGLRGDFNLAMDKLLEAMRAVADATGGIRSGAGEITQAADDLSRRTEHQAASLEQTAAALDQITATVKRTAEGAGNARRIVSTSQRNAEHMSQVVGAAVVAMNRVDKSSTEISQIIGMIDEIAFQTNLLALNAGVEAARAGESGRGFAVVASEVRALAQRAAAAAKQIKTLISGSAGQVAEGVALVAETGSAIGQMLTQVAEIDAIVGEIAASAHEQATGLQQVNTAVNQMDQVTQQNAAMVEQSTAASHALVEEANTLGELIAGFVLEETGTTERDAAELDRSARRSRPMPAVPAA